MNDEKPSCFVRSLKTGDVQMFAPKLEAPNLVTGITSGGKEITCTVRELRQREIFLLELNFKVNHRHNYNYFVRKKLYKLYC